MKKGFAGEQSMTRTFGEKRYTVVYSGELYNCGELRRELEERGYRFETTDDTEVVLNGLVYIRNGFRQTNEWGICACLL